MKAKKTADANFLTLEKPAPVQGKPRSLRPMRSMVAVRSLKSKTAVAALAVKSEQVLEKH